MELPARYVAFILIYAFSLAAIEMIWHWRTGKTYAWRETSLSLIINLLRRLLVVGITAKVFTVLSGFVEPFQIWNLPVHEEGQWHWENVVLLFFSLEFFYYWFHRWSHEVRWLWATHSVHHSPNSIDFLTAERLGWTGGFARSLILFSPLVLMGFDPHTISAAYALNLLYQYWLHTEMIGKLGPLEWILNTPAHHRIHHASNIRYLDANYGGVLILFDRLFGSFRAEDSEERIVYGLLHPLHSWNPLKIVFNEWIAIAKDVKAHWRKPKHVLAYLFAAPGWSHDGSRLTSRQLQAEFYVPKGSSRDI